MRKEEALTKDSICKDCEWRKCVVYQERGVEGDLLAIEEATSCKQFVAGDVSGDVKVLKCSEFKKIERPRPKI